MSAEDLRDECVVDFVPITGYQLKGFHKNREVWNFDVNGNTLNPVGTVFNRPYLPEGTGP